MTSMAVLPGLTPVHRRHPSALTLLAAAVAVGAVGLASILFVDRLGDDSQTAATVVAPSVAPVEAIDRWLTANRDAIFPGADGPFLGTCPERTSGPTIGLCSSLREDLGEVQLHSVGAFATDWGADLLLERSGARAWVVTGVSPWPQLGMRYDGSPWSPVTAITAWWHERAAARYGPGAAHLRSCSDAVPTADATAQPLLCSVLIDARDGVRTYASGLAGAPPDVELTVVERPDRTWLVTTARDVREGA